MKQYAGYFEERRFSYEDFNRAKKSQMCICANFNNKTHEAKPPYNRSCPYHGEQANR